MDYAMHRLAFFFSLKVPHTITFFLSNIPSILSSVYSPPLSEALNLSPFLVTLAFPPFLLLARAYVRAPSDFFPVFMHRSFFLFRNIIDGAMHLSPFPSPPSGPLSSPSSRSSISSGRRPCGLARSHPASPTSANPWTRAGNLLTRGCCRQEALIARYLGDLLLNP